MPSSPYLSCSDKSHLIAPTPKKARKPPLLRNHPSLVWKPSLSHVGIESPPHVYSVTWSRMPNAGCRVRSVSTQERGKVWTHTHPTWAWLGHHTLVTCGSPARIHIDSGLCFLIKDFIALEETWDQGVLAPWCFQLYDSLHLFHYWDIASTIWLANCIGTSECHSLGSGVGILLCLPGTHSHFTWNSHPTGSSSLCNTPAGRWNLGPSFLICWELLIASNRGIWWNRCHRTSEVR